MGTRVSFVDLDAFVAAHRAQWLELEQLVGQSRLQGVQVDRLVDLYQATATHLSVLRTTSPDPALVLSLSNLLARARRRAGRERTASFSTVATFFTHTFPAALYRLRRWWIATALASVALGVAVGLWFGTQPQLLGRVMTPEQIRQLVEHDFSDYYRTYAASHFALEVWTNNAFLALLEVALGVLGYPVVAFLWSNILNVALSGALMTEHHRGLLFWSLILPHGLLELTAVFVAGGAGLRLFWSWVEPGRRTRTESVAHEGRTTVMLALGLAVVLAVSGLIEAFVTPSPLPTAARIGVGVLAWVAFLAYALVLGRRRVAAGFDGDIDMADRAEYMVAAD